MLLTEGHFNCKVYLFILKQKLISGHHLSGPVLPPFKFGFGTFHWPFAVLSGLERITQIQMDSVWFLKFRWGVCVLSLNSSDNTPVWSWTRTHANVHEFPQDLRLCQLGHSDRAEFFNFLFLRALFWLFRFLKVKSTSRYLFWTFIFYARGQSLYELWVTTFLPNWQPPLIFMQFISNFFCMCSNSVDSAHVILK